MNVLKLLALFSATSFCTQDGADFTFLIAASKNQIQEEFINIFSATVSRIAIKILFDDYFSTRILVGLNDDEAVDIKTLRLLAHMLFTIQDKLSFCMFQCTKSKEDLYCSFVNNVTDFLKKLSNGTTMNIRFLKTCFSQESPVLYQLSKKLAIMYLGLLPEAEKENLLTETLVKNIFNKCDFKTSYLEKEYPRVVLIYEDLNLNSEFNFFLKILEIESNMPEGKKLHIILNPQILLHRHLKKRWKKCGNSGEDKNLNQTSGCRSILKSYIESLQKFQEAQKIQELEIFTNFDGHDLPSNNTYNDPENQNTSSFCFLIPPVIFAQDVLYNIFDLQYCEKHGYSFEQHEYLEAMDKTNEYCETLFTSIGRKNIIYSPYKDFRKRSDGVVSSGFLSFSPYFMSKVHSLNSGKTRFWSWNFFIDLIMFHNTFGDRFQSMYIKHGSLTTDDLSKTNDIPIKLDADTKTYYHLLEHQNTSCILDTFLSQAYVEGKFVLKCFSQPDNLETDVSKINDAISDHCKVDYSIMNDKEVPLEYFFENIDRRTIMDLYELEDEKYECYRKFWVSHKVLKDKTAFICTRDLFISRLKRVGIFLDSPIDEKLLYKFIESNNTPRQLETYKNPDKLDDFLITYRKQTGYPKTGTLNISPSSKGLCEGSGKIQEQLIEKYYSPEVRDTNLDFKKGDVVIIETKSQTTFDYKPQIAGSTLENALLSDPKPNTLLISSKNENVLEPEISNKKSTNLASQDFVTPHNNDIGCLPEKVQALDQSASDNSFYSIDFSEDNINTQLQMEKQEEMTPKQIVTLLPLKSSSLESPEPPEIDSFETLCGNKENSLTKNKFPSESKCENSDKNSNFSKQQRTKKTASSSFNMVQPVKYGIPNNPEIIDNVMQTHNQAIDICRNTKNIQNADVKEDAINARNSKTPFSDDEISNSQLNYLSHNTTYSQQNTNGLISLEPSICLTSKNRKAQSSKKLRSCGSVSVTITKLESSERCEESHKKDTDLNRENSATRPFDHDIKYDIEFKAILPYNNSKNQDGIKPNNPLNFDDNSSTTNQIIKRKSRRQRRNEKIKNNKKMATNDIDVQDSLNKVQLDPNMPIENKFTSNTNESQNNLYPVPSLTEQILSTQKIDNDEDIYSTPTYESLNDSLKTLNGSVDQLLDLGENISNKSIDTTQETANTLLRKTTDSEIRIFPGHNTETSDFESYQLSLHSYNDVSNEKLSDNIDELYQELPCSVDVENDSFFIENTCRYKNTFDSCVKDDIQSEQDINSNFSELLASEESENTIKDTEKIVITSTEADFCQTFATVNPLRTTSNFIPPIYTNAPLENGCRVTYSSYPILNFSLYPRFYFTHQKIHPLNVFNFFQQYSRSDTNKKIQQTRISNTNHKTLKSDSLQSHRSDQIEQYLPLDFLANINVQQQTKVPQNYMKNHPCSFKTHQGDLTYSVSQNCGPSSSDVSLNFIDTINVVTAKHNETTIFCKIVYNAVHTNSNTNHEVIFSCEKYDNTKSSYPQTLNGVFYNAVTSQFLSLNERCLKIFAYTPDHLFNERILYFIIQDHLDSTTFLRYMKCTFCRITGCMDFLDIGYLLCPKFIRGSDLNKDLSYVDFNHFIYFPRTNLFEDCAIKSRFKICRR